MKKGKQPRVKKPQHQGNRPKIFSRTLLLEVLIFAALGVFGFGIVTTLLGQNESAESQMVSFVQAVTSGDEEGMQTSPMLYEAPSKRPTQAAEISQIFMPSVQYWEDDVIEWATEAGIDPDLLATVMQIESCGSPEVESWVGAAGLFQVMPFHFEEDEDHFDPATNALRGATYLKAGLEVSQGNAGLALAGYNGGHGVINREYDTWPTETQRYYRWGSGIYREASAGWDTSPTLLNWLNSGGQSLCDQAELHLGLAESLE